MCGKIHGVTAHSGEDTSFSQSVGTGSAVNISSYLDKDMDIPWLNCPSVWWKKILSSRSQVEQSYAHGLRRWAGYQRYRLQMDKGKSAEPFRQILELMIRDAERQADVIDKNIYNMGDTPEGVMGRIKNFESDWYKPRRQRLRKRMTDLRDTTHRVNRSHVKSEVIINNLAVDTQDARCAWIKLQKDRSKHLAECLSEFVTCLEARQSNRDVSSQMETFSTRQMEAAFKKLSAVWLQDFDTQLRHVPALGDVDSSTSCYGKSDTALTTPSECPSTLSATEVPESDPSGNKDEEPNDLVKADPSSSIRSLSGKTNPSLPRRYPTSINNLAVVPLANVSKGILKLPSSTPDQILNTRRPSEKVPECVQVKLLEENYPLPSTGSLIPFITTGPPPRVVKLRASNPYPEVTAENIQRMQEARVEDIIAEGQRSKLNPSEIKINPMRCVCGDNKMSLQKYPKIPDIPSLVQPSMLTKARSTPKQIATVPVSKRRSKKTVGPPKIVSLYHHRFVQADGKSSHSAKNKPRSVVKGITIRLPPMT